MAIAARLWIVLAVALAAGFLTCELVLLARTGRQPVVSVEAFEEEVEGHDEQEPVSHRSAVEACFAAESYRPGEVAELRLYDRATNVTLGLYRVGDATGRLQARDEMRGTPVGTVRRLKRVSPGRTIRIRLGRGWPSGLYFARLSAAHGRVGYAPFVLAPARLGEHAIAVVLPTQTRQAYNFRDDDGNGTQDTGMRRREGSSPPV